MGNVNGVLGALAVGLLLAGCVEPGARTEDVAPGTSVSKIVDVEHTAVERQSIGNCWVYAGATWAESMHRRATGTDFDTSQSYWTYLYWFMQLTESDAVLEGEIVTGGNWRDIAIIMLRYGIMAEADFTPTDGLRELSLAQADALERMNVQLGVGGALETEEARRDPLLVRQVLDEAWALPPELRAQLDQTFGADMARTFDRGTATADGTSIIEPGDFEVRYTRGSYGVPDAQSLADAAQEWRQVNHSTWRARRTMQRVQRAMHAREPVVLAWFVDFNALEEDPRSPLYGSFNMETLEATGEPGRQGGHMVVVEDYQARVQVPETNAVGEWAVEAGVPMGELLPLAFEGPSTHLDEGETLEVVMAGAGDADLYIRKGAPPTLERGGYDCRPYVDGSDESCTVSGPADVFVSINGYRPGQVSVQLTKHRTQTVTRVLEAGVTLDPEDPEDAALLAAALADEAELDFVRIKNSWGANRDGLPMAAFTERGYHDLYMDYLDGVIAEEEACPDGFESESCERAERTLYYFVLPPGY